MKKETQNETAIQNVEKSNLPMFQYRTTNIVKLRICLKIKEYWYGIPIGYVGTWDANM